MREDVFQAKSKIVDFIKSVKNNDFYEVNEIFEINLETVKNKTNKDNELVLKLLEQIKQGKTNEDIIKERIEYLYSDEYKSEEDDFLK